MTAFDEVEVIRNLPEGLPRMDVEDVFGLVLPRFWILAPGRAAAGFVPKSATRCPGYGLRKGWRRYVDLGFYLPEQPKACFIAASRDMLYRGFLHILPWELRPRGYDPARDAVIFEVAVDRRGVRIESRKTKARRVAAGSPG